MTVAVSYPGVYIDEFAPGAPVQAASTNIAAFLGPLLKGPVVGAKGPIKDPVKVTSWDQFKATFGARPAPGFFTWYAVRGFFENGGTACYVSRVTNATYVSSVIANKQQQALADIYSIDVGAVTTQILVDFQNPLTPLLPTGAKLFKTVISGVTVNGSEITIAQKSDPGDGSPPNDARNFRVGDWVVVRKDDQPLGKPARVRTVTPTGLVIDERYGLNITDAEVRLVYNIGGDVRVEVPGKPEELPPDALSVGTTVQFKAPIFDGPDNTDTQVIEATRAEQITKNFRTYRLTLRDGFRTQVDPTADVGVTTLTFHVEISQGGSPLRFTHLASDPVSARYYVKEINRAGHLVRVVAKDPMPFVHPDGLVPNLSPVSLVSNGDFGKPETLDKLSDTDFIEALNNLRRAGDVRLVSIPDGYPRKDDDTPPLTSAVQAAMIAHCEQMGDRFAVIDAKPDLELFGAGRGDGNGSIETQRGSLDSQRGYAALYYPWIRVTAAGSGPPLLVPPSGHISGLMARVDNTKGVFKAPANETLQGAIGIERTMTDSEHGLLNVQGINIIRVFREGGRPYVFGARTTATDLNWNYVNVRRLFLFLEKSIQDGIKWAVFEPSNKALWDKLRQTISAFLTTQWKSGAFFGSSPKEAQGLRT
ncbi:phage tail sheath family protein [Zavarzinella formosa]|uniref:phage tail sheath family protein n=1 Tax=Zavarzinella formosa TaxID=360055 RepID=UPI0002F0DDC0|nr:phage tail sheath subtilisin-like domain-containing protein [Zavarzinella formosa]